MSRFVLITRHPSDCVALQELLSPYGLKLRPYPVLRIEDRVDDQGWQAISRALPDAAAEAWLVLASPRAPEPFVRGCRDHGAEHLLDLPAAAVGSATAEAALDEALKIELVGPGTGTGLAQLLNDTVPAGTTFVLAGGEERRPELPRDLTSGGHTLLPVVVYRMAPTPPRELPPLGPSLDAVVLTSPRAAALYLDGVGGMALPCQHWALGPTTQQAATDLGIACRIPNQPTMESLAEELCTI